MLSRKTMLKSTIKMGIKEFHLAGFSRIVNLKIRSKSIDHHNSSDATAILKSERRDLVNFPRPQRTELPGQVRFGFIPREWFDFFYHRTGVTGPYVIALGTSTFLVSKEIYVLEHNFYGGISTAILTMAAIKTLGPRVAAYADKEIEKLENQFKEARIHQIKQLEEAVNHEKQEQNRAKGQILLFEAKRLTVAYQLEAEYRERVMEAYRKVKQRLEWEVEQERVLRDVYHKHMVQWIHSEVKQTVVSNAFDKHFLKKCIEELVSMAPHIEKIPKQGGSVPEIVVSHRGSFVIPLLCRI